MSKFLNWLNGKKTAIGAVILLVFTSLAAFGVKIPSVSENQIMHYIDLVIQYGGIVLTVWGVIHKALKGDFSGITAAINK